MVVFLYHLRMAASGQVGGAVLNSRSVCNYGNPAFEGSYENRLSKQLYLELLLYFYLSQ